ncbi:MAG: gamma-glutamyl-gamma-aminobutyrate hydrolase family protein [Lachnospiraceae bacterium]|nr:gamma-glutamyl-gamma-aminobutyrate hydrolase family protein [Lachnospiraceae bacterium]
MKTVLISTSTHKAENYCKALQEAGITPVVSGNMEDVSKYDGLLLPGGGDIAPILFHERKNGSRDICISEDIIQLLLFDRFLEQKKPIFGICKGMQLINVALGGSILQDLPARGIHDYHNGDRYHITRALPGSLLHTLYGTDFVTNSAHHQSLAAIGKNLTVIQYSYDKIPEGIVCEGVPIFGVQWHPERLLSKKRPAYAVSGLPLFIHLRKLLEVTHQ